MKILGVGDYCDLGAMYLRLGESGHDVKVYVRDKNYHDVYANMLNFIFEWRDELAWIHEAGSDGIIIFESANYGIFQDHLRKQGYQVIGGSAFGDSLEGNREFGQQIMRNIGMQTAKTYQFNNYDKAIEFININKKRYVYKNNGAECLRTQNYVGMSENSSDLISLLSHYSRQIEVNSNSVDFILMDYIEGIEIGVGAYFNGENFLEPACLDWEHKHFFNGNLGELTDEMGTIVTFRGSNFIFQNTLLRLKGILKESGYCGYINLNMIANEEGLWPLEFTSRFGYPGYAICAELQVDSWGKIFKSMLNKTTINLETYKGFAIGIVLTVPPFPYNFGYDLLSKGLPILFKPSFNYSDSNSIHFKEVARSGDQLVTSGFTGNVATIVCSGESIEEAQRKAYTIAEEIIIPNIRYRQDIGNGLINGELKQLIDWGYIFFE